MKGPTYILKKTHLENDEKREYKQHQERLKTIQEMRTKDDIIRSYSVDKKFIEDKEQKKLQNRLFKEEEQKRIQKIENKVLVSKLEEISKGKYSILKNIKEQMFKESLQYVQSQPYIKTGQDFNPNSTQRQRIRIMTANTQPLQNPQYKNSYKQRDRLDNQITLQNLSNESKGSNFNKNQDLNLNNSQKKQRVSCDFSQKYERNQNSDLSYTQNQQNQFNNNQSKDNSQNQVNTDKSQNLTDKTEKDKNSSLSDQKVNQVQPYKFCGIHYDLSRNNPNYKYISPNKQGKQNESENKIMKTEGDENKKYDYIHYSIYSKDQSLIHQNELYQVNNQENMEFKNQLSSEKQQQQIKDNKRRRIHSLINLSSLNKHVTQTLERQRQQERIAIENSKILERMMKLPSVVPTKSSLKKEFIKQKQLKKQIQKFHEFKERQIPKYLRNKLNSENIMEQIADNSLDENNQDLMNQLIHLIINVKQIAFANFLPLSIETEKYFMEIQASVHEIRRTNPEVFSDFSKSVINESFFLKELKSSKIVYIALYKWTPLDNSEVFLGDFELELSPYYIQSGVHQVKTIDLKLNITREKSQIFYFI